MLADCGRVMPSGSGVPTPFPNSTGDASPRCPTPAASPRAAELIAAPLAARGDAVAGLLELHPRIPVSARISPSAPPATLTQVQRTEPMACPILGFTKRGSARGP